MSNGKGGRSAGPSATKFINKNLSEAVKKLQGGKVGRSFSVLDIIAAYKAGVSAQGGKGGRSSLPKAHPQKGKYKRGGKVRRKTK